MKPKIGKQVKLLCDQVTKKLCNTIFPFHNVNDCEFPSVLSTLNEIYRIHVLSISVEPFMHNEGSEKDVTDPASFLIHF